MSVGSSVLLEYKTTLSQLHRLAVSIGRTIVNDELEMMWKELASPSNCSIRLGGLWQTMKTCGPVYFSSLSPNQER
jgi:hypothetical protein